MSNHIRRSLGLAAILLLLAAAPQPVGADGIVLPPPEAHVAMPDQKAILVYNEERGHEDLILSVGLLGGSEAAWVVPVPSLPDVKAASPAWFEQLDALTAPEIVSRTEGNCPIPQSLGVEAGVELLSREQVGVYDVSILSADEPGALLDWLNKNGYTFPEEGGPLLDSYVEEGGWYFVAARVLPGESAPLGGDVHPLWISFDSEQPVYPMRLTALMKGSVDVLIYMLAEHRMRIAADGFETEFAGELMLQPRSEEADLLSLLTSRAYYVTRLRNGHLYAPELTEDLYPRRVWSDKTYRKVVERIEYVCPPANAGAAGSEGLYGLCGWLVLGAGLALFGLLIGLSVIWRRQSRRRPGEKPDA